jgi:hypothetical protein
MRGSLDKVRYAEEVARVRDKIDRSDEPHWQEFRAAWQADGNAE